MKYINSYKLFEQIDISVEKMEQDIEDILLELKDLNRFHIKIYTDLVNFTTYRNNRAVIYIALMPKYGYDGFDIDEVSEYLLRIKDYLGDKYDSCGFVPVGFSEREFIDLSEENIARIIKNKYVMNRIANIIILVK